MNERVNAILEKVRKISKILNWGGAVLSHISRALVDIPKFPNSEEE